MKASAGFLSLTLYSQVVPFVEQLTYEFMAPVSLYELALDFVATVLALASDKDHGSVDPRSVFAFARVARFARQFGAVVVERSDSPVFGAEFTDGLVGVPLRRTAPAQGDEANESGTCDQLDPHKPSAPALFAPAGGHCVGSLKAAGPEIVSFGESSLSHSTSTGATRDPCNSSYSQFSTQSARTHSPSWETPSAHSPSP